MLIGSNHSSNYKPILSGLFEGTVVENNDPKMIGRLKVSVPGVLEGDKEYLPWVEPRMPYFLGGSSVSEFFSIPEIGSIVYIEFEHNSPYFCRYSSAPSGQKTRSSSISKSDYPNIWRIKDSTGFKFEVNKNTGEVQILSKHGSGIKISETGETSILSNGSLKNLTSDGKAGFVTSDKDESSTIIGNSLNINVSSIKEESGDKIINSGKVKETYALKDETINGNYNKQVVGNSVSSSLGNYELAVTGDYEKTIFQKKTETIGLGESKTIVAGGKTEKILQGDIDITLMTGSFKVNCLVQSVDIKSTTTATLAGAIKTSLGTGTSPMILGDQLATLYSSLQVPTATGTSGPPINAPQIIQALSKKCFLD